MTLKTYVKEMKITFIDCESFLFLFTLNSSNSNNQSKVNNILAEMPGIQGYIN